MSSTSLPLPIFFAQTLQSLVPIFDDSISPSDQSAQSTLPTALNNLQLISRMLTSLGVFSINETVEELGDGEMVFMTLGWVIAECEGKGGLGGPADRIGALRRSEVRHVLIMHCLLIARQTAMNDFLALLSSYAVLSPEEQAESSAAAGDGISGPRDPAKRREAKIRQYRREKELREHISVSNHI